ncbi:MAG: 50S ribosomal protein L6 [Thermoplasmata archaeon]|nr:50S ribosomal protein L6 [Thermoplasmata archaeon]
MPVAARIEKRTNILEGASASLKKGMLTITGPKGALSREFHDPKITLAMEGKEVVIKTELPQTREKALVGTWNAHVNNMLRGVTEGFTYRMKLVYSHFPVKVSVKGDQVVIENFSGEKSPRFARIMEGAKVTAKGDQVTIEGIDKENVGQSMANIERATRIKGFDRRVFQDGIYLVAKE